MLRRGALIFADMATVAGVVWLTYLIRFDFSVWPHYMDQMWNVLPIFILVRITSHYYFGVYQLFWRYCGINDLFSVIRSVAFGSALIISVDHLQNYAWGLIVAGGIFLSAAIHRISLLNLRLSRLRRLFMSLLAAACLTGLLAAVMIFTQAEQVPANLTETGLGKSFHLTDVTYEFPIPRSVLLLEGILAFLAISTVRLSPRLWYEVQGRPSALGRKTIAIYGAGDFGEAIARAINSQRTEFRLLGFIDDDPTKHERAIHGFPVLGGHEKLEEIIEGHGVDEVLIALDDLSESRLQSVITVCRSYDVDVRRLPKLSLYLSGRVDASAFVPSSGSDLLGREEVELDREAIAGYLNRSVVLVTGAGGSIGSELCRQIAGFSPARMILLGKGEASIHSTLQDLKRILPELPVEAVIADIRNATKLDRVIAETNPHILFHAAAHKHVPFMERDPDEAVSTIFLGTRTIAECAACHGVARFVLISTDKAVRPRSVMGASKRLAEQEIQRLSELETDTRFLTVRFGNVLGSRGSVVPIFERQIREGGPVTVTHPDMHRYLMTIPEAVRLVLHSAAVAENGELCILDMGKPVRILDLAENMIRLAGFEPYEDIPIQFTGIRPGEKLSEELMTDGHVDTLRRLGSITICRNRKQSWSGWDEMTDELREAAKACDEKAIKNLLCRYVPDYDGDSRS